MGANQALRLATHNLDTFAYMGGFSGTMNGLSTDPLDPAAAFGGVFKDGAAFNRKGEAALAGHGHRGAAIRSRVQSEPSARCSTRPGSSTSYFSSPGTAHEWLTWRRDLNDFAPRLFR